jgi:hypothetical protein
MTEAIGTIAAINTAAIVATVGHLLALFSQFRDRLIVIVPNALFTNISMLSNRRL